MGHDRPWDINVPKSHFYELILQDRHPNTISKLSAKYQFCAISTADTRDGKLTTRGVYPWVVHRLSIVCPPFVHRLYPPIEMGWWSKLESAHGLMEGVDVWESYYFIR